MAHHYALFSARYQPLVGGVESFTRSMAHELTRVGHRVSVVTSQVGDAPVHEAQGDGVEVHRLPCHALMDGRLPVSRHSRAYRAQMRQLRAAGVDRVVINTRFYPHSLEGLRFARAVGAPAVMLDHGSAYLVLGSPVADAALRAYEHVITWAGRRYGPRYAGVSRLSARWLRTFGIRTAQVVPNAIDAPAFRALASGRDIRRELGVCEGQTLVVFVGRLALEKGALELARAARLLGDSFVVAFAGDGAQRERIASMGLGNVRLLGALGRADLSALLAQGDVFCLPSRSEGFCTSLLEAGAWGLVPAITHVGGVDELMGSPVRYGRLLANTTPTTIAWTLAEMVAGGECGHLEAWARDVEEHHSWVAAAQALDAAFAGA